MGERYLVKSSGGRRTERGRSLYYATYWRTHQISDHLPMWMEFRIDFGKEYIERKLGNTPPSILTDARLS